MLPGLQRAACLALPLAHHAACQAEFDFVGEQVPLGAVANGTYANCVRACKQLLAADRADLRAYYLDLPPDFQEQYYAVQQKELTPTCVAEPQSAEAVGLVVQSVKEYQCPFVVKGGGHSVATGTSNTNNGLVIDLRYMNQITVSEDRSQVSIGPGARWVDVYLQLEPLGLLVVGGRVSSVGVGGFMIGGGISGLSRRYGWALDNVLNYEVVLPNGTVANVNQKSHPDLFFALRGGGPAFGVVTRFDVAAYPHTKVWAGTVVNIVGDLSEKETELGLQEKLDWSLHSAGIKVVRWLQNAGTMLGYGARGRDYAEAFAQLASDDQKDIAAHAYIFYSWIPYMKFYVTGGTFIYSEPVENPPVFSNLTSIPHMSNTGGLKQMSEMTDEIEKLNLYGYRHYWRTATFKVNAAFISELFDIVLAETYDYRVAVPKGLPSCNLQLITKHEIGLFSSNGGNAFGIKPEDGPLFLFSVTINYDSAKDDELTKRVGDAILDKAEARAKELGLYHSFVYRNYASSQNAFAGFSAENQKRLLEIQEAYDPGRAFANLLPELVQLQA